MNDNNPAEDTFLIIIAIFAVFAIIKENADKIILFLEKVAIFVGECLVVVLMAFIIYQIIRGIYMKIKEFKEMIDDFIKWRAETNESLKEINERIVDQSGDISNVKYYLKMHKDHIAELHKEMERVKDILGLDQKDLVSDAAKEVLNEEKEN
tara:strand:- start:6 stop:461 length:456 start_codon:yes stop_codon:yes gene_type:complete